MSGVDTRGLDELEKKMTDALKTFPEKRRIFHSEAGDILEQEIVKRTPYDKNRKRKTHLRDAIYQKVGSQGGYAAVRADIRKAPHAHLVENGHVMTGHKSSTDVAESYKPLSVKGGEAFVQGKHMFKNGAKAAKRRIIRRAETFVKQIMEGLE